MIEDEFYNFLRMFGQMNNYYVNSTLPSSKRISVLVKKYPNGSILDIRVFLDQNEAIKYFKNITIKGNPK